MAELARNTGVLSLHTQKAAPVAPAPTRRERLRAAEDTDVVAAFLAGEEMGFELLVERYQTRLLNFIYRTIGDREKAKTWFRKSSSASIATCTASTHPRSSAPGSTPSPRPWRRMRPVGRPLLVKPVQICLRSDLFRRQSPGRERPALRKSGWQGRVRLKQPFQKPWLDQLPLQHRKKWRLLDVAARRDAGPASGGILPLTEPLLRAGHRASAYPVHPPPGRKVSSMP
ncbi:MAG: hypothetical protein U5K74_10690 [Gemmatimonadaceae bacterium]|nr:hypothetical protein [Gemmatimonadaceae bacterium]